MLKVHGDLVIIMGCIVSDFMFGSFEILKPYTFWNDYFPILPK